MDKIKNSEIFFLSRFNDGEWFCMKGYNGSNCDGHKYYKKLGKDLVNLCNSDRNIELEKKDIYISFRTMVE